MTPGDIVAIADALRPRLLEEQAATEERTRYSEELHETFRDAGFYRLLCRGATAASRSTSRRSTAR